MHVRRPAAAAIAHVTVDESDDELADKVNTFDRQQEEAAMMNQEEAATIDSALQNLAAAVEEAGAVATGEDQDASTQAVGGDGGDGGGGGEVAEADELEWWERILVRPPTVGLTTILSDREIKYEVNGKHEVVSLVEEPEPVLRPSSADVAAPQKPQQVEYDPVLARAKAVLAQSYETDPVQSHGHGHGHGHSHGHDDQDHKPKREIKYKVLEVSLSWAGGSVDLDASCIAYKDGDSATEGDGQEKEHFGEESLFVYYGNQKGVGGAVIHEEDGVGEKIVHKGVHLQMPGTAADEEKETTTHDEKIKVYLEKVE